MIEKLTEKELNEFLDKKEESLNEESTDESVEENVKIDPEQFAKDVFFESSKEKVMEGVHDRFSSGKLNSGDIDTYKQYKKIHQFSRDEFRNKILDIVMAKQEIDTSDLDGNLTEEDLY